MKKFSLPLLLLFIMIIPGCRKDIFPWQGGSINKSPIVNNTQHPLKDSIETIIARYIAKGIPGIQVTIKNDQGWYMASGGYSSLETKDTLNASTPGWFFSLTKVYTASLVMLEKEKGNISLDSSIDKYLPIDISEGITRSREITVRMLLNHTSGLLNFTDLPEYITGQFTHPEDQPTIPELLSMVYEKNLIAEPGTKYFYSNTNYLLLYVMLEHITGKDYDQLLKKQIITPLRLRNTYYKVSPEKASSLKFPNYYFDRQSNDQLENVTLWNHYIGEASYGWGGISGTPADAIIFFEALMKGKVVSHSSLDEMITWFKEEGADAPSYGLGIEYWQFKEGSTPQRGHEGDGIGNSTMILYVPDNNTYLFINCTAGRKIPGPYLFKITDFKNEMGRFVSRVL
jgi:D-alanyl-D-alanine carboxypeptidase